MLCAAENEIRYIPKSRDETSRITWTPTFLLIAHSSCTYLEDILGDI